MKKRKVCIVINISQLKFLYPLKTLAFTAFSPLCFALLPHFFLARRNEGNFFRLSLQPYPAALRKFAWPLWWWRGRKCSSQGTYIRMSQQLLHILGCCPVERRLVVYVLPQQMEVKIIHIPDLLSGVSAHTADRCRGFISSIGRGVNEGNLGVTFWWCSCPGQGIDLIVGAVLFLDDAVVVL